jgi:hypothetical protein
MKLGFSRKENYEAVGMKKEEQIEKLKDDWGKIWESIKKNEVYVLIGTILSLAFILWRNPTPILVITAWILLFYTYETHMMRKEMLNQTIIHSIMGSTPFISIFIDEFPADPRNIRKCSIKNIGEGTAIDIELKSLQPINNVTVLFKEIDVLPKGEKRELEILGPNLQDDASRDAFLSNVLILPDTMEFFFDLKYKNILYEPYEAQMVLKGGRFSLKEKPKKKHIRYY